MARVPSPEAQLLVILPAGEIRVALTAPVTSIGSDPGCTIVLDRPGVAARHCVIQRDDDGRFEVFDLVSDAGTSLNGRPIEAAPLATGDMLGVGTVRIVFLSRDSKPTPRPPARAHAVPRPPVAPGLGVDDDGPVLALAEDPWDALRADAEIRVDTVDAAPALGASPPAPLPPPPRPAGPGILARLRNSARGLAAALGAGIRPRETTHETAAEHPSATSALDSSPSFPDASARGRDETFADALVSSLRQTPFLIVSLIVHAAILIALHALTVPRAERTNRLPFTAAFEGQELDREVAPVVTNDDVDEIDAPIDEAEPEIEQPATEIADPLEAAPEAAPDRAGPDLSGAETPFEAGVGGDAAGLSGLAGAGAIRGRSEGFKRYARGLRESGLDIVFVIDSTGSMGSVLARAREQVNGMIATLAAIVPGFRLGIVTYRDRRDAYLTWSQPLTPYRYQAVHFLDRVEADGGGDLPEAVLDGLREAANDFAWSPKARRIIVLVGDAPPHKTDSAALKRLCADFAAKRGTIHCLVTPVGGFGTRREESVSEDAVRAFEEIARAGGGVAATLESTATLMQAIMTIAFGREHADDARAALASVESDWRAKHFENFVAKADARAVLDALRKRPVNELLVRALFRTPRADFVPAYFESLADRSMAQDARWAAAVLLRRVFEADERGARALPIVQELTPDLDARSFERRLNDAKKAAVVAGFVVGLPPAPRGAEEPPR